MDHCAPDPCENGGQCSIDGETFRCQCPAATPPRFSGPKCEVGQCLTDKMCKVHNVHLSTFSSTNAHLLGKNDKVFSLDSSRCFQDNFGSTLLLFLRGSDMIPCDGDPCNSTNTDKCLNAYTDGAYVAVCQCKEGYEGSTCDSSKAGGFSLYCSFLDRFRHIAKYH